jgi:hypothetical protein
MSPVRLIFRVMRKDVTMSGGQKKHVDCGGNILLGVGDNGG